MEFPIAKFKFSENHVGRNNVSENHFPIFEVYETSRVKRTYLTQCNRHARPSFPPQRKPQQNF